MITITLNIFFLVIRFLIFSVKDSDSSYFYYDMREVSNKRYNLLIDQKLL
jgi:hypothetical protein